MFLRNRRVLATGAIVVAMTMSAAAVIAQRGSDAPAGGSLADVVAELRQLRLSVEESTRRQAETHALGVYLSSQQGRVVQVASRWDAARRELDAVSLRSTQLSAAFTNNEEELRAAKPEVRAQLEARSRALKEELETVPAELRQAQIREAELSQLLQAEEARWTDLIARLEVLVKR